MYHKWSIFGNLQKRPNAATKIAKLNQAKAGLNHAFNVENNLSICRVFAARFSIRFVPGSRREKRDMKPGQKDSYTNTALRRLMRARHAIDQTFPAPITTLINRRMAETTYQALRFRYRMPSTWDVLK